MDQNQKGRGDRTSLDDIRRRFTDEWESLKARVRGRFDRLTEDDVGAVNGSYEEFSSRIGKAYGYDDDRTRDEIAHFVGTRSIEEFGVDAADDEADEDDRPTGPFYGRSDRVSGERWSTASQPARTLSQGDALQNQQSQVEQSQRSFNDVQRGVPVSQPPRQPGSRVSRPSQSPDAPHRPR